MKFYKRILFFSLLILTFASCAVKKYIPEDELLFRGGKIKLSSSEKLENKKDIQNTLEDVLYPEPNSKFLGMYPGLHYYYVYQQKKHNFWRKFMYEKMGQKPAYFSDVNIDDTKDLMENRLENKGLFYPKIDYEVKIDSSSKTAKVDYEVRVGQPYTIKTFQFERGTAGVDSLDQIIERALANTTIKEGNAFDLDEFKAERQRIDDYLKNRGYYYFNKEFLLFQADTNQRANREIDLYLRLKEEMPEKAKYPYIINDVEVLASVYNDTVYGKQDTVDINGVKIIQNEKNIFFKPKRLRPFILLRSGQPYSSQFSRYSSRRLSNLGTYKFVNIQYADADTLVDSLGHRHLKSTISLSPFPKRRLQLKMEGVTKSNDFAGPGIGVVYGNRNIFKGGENFSLETNFGYEKQFSRKTSGDRSLSVGVKASLLFPRIIFPWTIKRKFEYDIPKTKVSVGVDFLDRAKLYSLNSYSGSFGYIWNQNRFITHQINLLDINYVRLSHVSDRFQEVLDENPFLEKSFENQFIAGITYTFTFNQLNDPTKRGRFYVQFNLDAAGNGLDFLAKKNAQGEKKILGLRYAQYVKGDVDVSYHFDLNRSGEQTLVGHFFGGYGRPYGNSKALPFVKQYFAGGPYSLRAFRIRGIGPGTYKPESNSAYSYFDQAGDIRLEANVEYRFPIISVLKGGVFVDAGNVWLQEKNEALPGGKFSKNFYKELGIGAGFGLRVDVQGFVIRLDLSSSLKTPTESWKFDYKNPMFNFGIGYPF